MLIDNRNIAHAAREVERIARLIDEFGFDTVDVGPLKEGARTLTGGNVRRALEHLGMVGAANVAMVINGQTDVISFASSSGRRCGLS